MGKSDKIIGIHDIGESYSLNIILGKCYNIVNSGTEITHAEYQYA